MARRCSFITLPAGTPAAGRARTSPGSRIMCSCATRLRCRRSTRGWPAPLTARRYRRCARVGAGRVARGSGADAGRARARTAATWWTGSRRRARSSRRPSWPLIHLRLRADPRRASRRAGEQHQCRRDPVVPGPGVPRRDHRTRRRRSQGTGSSGDLEVLRVNLATIPSSAAGVPPAGPIGELPPRGRFRWLVSPRSTIIQPSAVHTGRTRDPPPVLEHFVETMVRRPGQSQ